LTLKITGAGMDRSVVREVKEIRAILEVACLNREHLTILARDGRFEADFIHLDDHSMHLAGATGLPLRPDEELALCFPVGTRTLEGNTRLQGPGQVAGQATLRVALPSMLLDDELRRAPRVTRVGQVEATFYNGHQSLRTGRLLDISTGGLKLGLTQAPDVAVGEALALTLPMDDHFRIRATAVVRWITGRTLGLEFQPGLDRATLALLSRWVFLTREQDTHAPAPAVAAARPAVAAGTLVLVADDETIEDTLREDLEGLGTLVRTAGDAVGLQAALLLRPAILFLHAGPGDRARLEALTGLLSPRTPCVLLGTGMDAAETARLAADLGLGRHFPYQHPAGFFFQRLVRGLLLAETAPRGS